VGRFNSQFVLYWLISKEEAGRLVGFRAPSTEKEDFPMRWLSSMHTAVTLFAALTLLDIASTYIGLQLGFSEANRLAAALLASGGEAAMFLFKAVISLAVIAMVIRLSPRYVRLAYGLYAANGVLGLVVLSNVVQLIVA
jgi:hypothetical protein